jgi:hypothetical protein
VKKKHKYLITIFGIFLVLLLFLKFYKFEAWSGEYYLPFYSNGGNLTSEIRNDWISNNPISTYSIDGKVCGYYGYNCVDVVKSMGLDKCILIGDLKTRDDFFVGRHVFEGKVVYGVNRVGCFPVGSYWWESKLTKITGKYRFSTWYGWFEADCDNKRFMASDGRSGSFDCDTQLTFISVWNFQVIFYKSAPTTTTITTTTTQPQPTTVTINYQQTTTTTISSSVGSGNYVKTERSLFDIIWDWLKSLFSWFFK